LLVALFVSRHIGNSAGIIHQAFSQPRQFSMIAGAGCEGGTSVPLLGGLPVLT